MINLLTILGARPQFIKASSLSRELKKHKDFKECILHTGQHYDSNMSDIFFEELGIPNPDFFLNVGSGNHGRQTAQMLSGIEEVLLKNQFDLVLVFGDTNTTLAGALAASKLNIPVAHVEAGLRSFNMKMPEEINRIITDQVSAVHFCPSQSAVENLRNSGIAGEYIANCGDIMYETLMHFKDIATKKVEFVSSLQLETDPYILITLHRQENTDNEVVLRSFAKAFGQLSNDYRIVFPMHPRTRKAFVEFGLMEKIERNCTAIDPVGFLEMINLARYATAILTDSGGLQKEAYFLGKHCIVLRHETEWHELLSSKSMQLWNKDMESNLSSCIQALVKETIIQTQLYGTGDTSKHITETIRKYCNENL